MINLQTINNDLRPLALSHAQSLAQLSINKVTCLLTQAAMIGVREAGTPNQAHQMKFSFTIHQKRKSNPRARSAKDVLDVAAYTFAKVLRFQTDVKKRINVCAQLGRTTRIFCDVLGDYLFLCLHRSIVSLKKYHNLTTGCLL